MIRDLLLVVMAVILLLLAAVLAKLDERIDALEQRPQVVVVEAPTAPSTTVAPEPRVHRA